MLTNHASAKKSSWTRNFCPERWNTWNGRLPKIINSSWFSDSNRPRDVYFVKLIVFGAFGNGLHWSTWLNRYVPQTGSCLHFSSMKMRWTFKNQKKTKKCFFREIKRFGVPKQYQVNPIWRENSETSWLFQKCDLYPFHSFGQEFWIIKLIVAGGLGLIGELAHAYY